MGRKGWGQELRHTNHLYNLQILDQEECFVKGTICWRFLDLLRPGHWDSICCLRVQWCHAQHTCLQQGFTFAGVLMKAP